MEDKRPCILFMPRKLLGSTKNAVLLVSSRIGRHDFFHGIFRDSPWELQRTWDEREALDTILDRHPKIGVVICEYSYRRYSWKFLLAEWNKTEVPPKLIVTSGVAAKRELAESQDLGVFDFLLDAPFDPDEVLRVTQRAWVASQASHPVNVL